MNPRLTLEGVSKRLGDLQLLNEVSLSVARSETVAIYGSSGGGKTVLLNVISGALTLDAGALTIDGEEVTTKPPEHRNVGMAFQNFALYPHMTAFENIASPLRSRKHGRVREQVEEIARLLKIDRFLTHLPSALSNGQKQRTSLARALVAGPAVLLLDDPLRNVDAKLRYEMRLEMPELFRRFESAVVYVTQDCREAMALADRIVILREGKFAQIGPPDEVYASPIDVEVARLLGEPTINLFPCSASVANGSEQINPAQLSLRLTQSRGLADGAAYLAGVRPEDVRIQAAGSTALPVHIEAVTPTNLRSLLVLRTSAGDEIIAACAEDEVRDMRTGQVLHIGFDAAKVLLFDTSDGRLLPASA